jgi:hypothetical protein
MNTKCRECEWIGETTQLLQAENPFELGDTLYGCPKCRSVNCFIRLCDEQGCTRDASCGWPSEEGYRQTCGKHWKEFAK